MVLWEITLATAYFLGLKRTYRLALKIQRRLIPHKHLKIRQFAHSRTRIAFDVALRVHRNIQERDIEVGRNLGNWILRCLDKMKPSANIRGAPHQEKPPESHQYGTGMTKQMTNHHQKNEDSVQRLKSFEKDSDRHLFSATRPTWPTSFPSITMMMRHPKHAGSTTQYRQLCVNGPQLLASTYGSLGFRGAIREDIRLWMQRN
ncbi:Hydrolase C26A3.11 [Bienertia sinuspersici]